MSGNTFGLLYCVTSFGESHGPAFGGVVDGCPPGLALAEEDIQKELDRRKPGTSRHVTQRRHREEVAEDALRRRGARLPRAARAAPHRLRFMGRGGRQSVLRPQSSRAP